MKMGSFNKRRELPFCPPSIEYFDTFIGNSTEIHGRVVATGSVRIDGKIIGNVESPTEANSSIALGRTGFIHGDIFAQRVLVAGLVEGNIYAKDRVTLHEGSEVRGDVTYTQISIENGAKINGLLIARNEEAVLNPSAQAFTESWEKIKSGS
jgi:cytoskeletal protein CcmA (bactofilin family)